MSVTRTTVVTTSHDPEYRSDSGSESHRNRSSLRGRLASSRIPSAGDGRDRPEGPDRMSFCAETEKRADEMILIPPNESLTSADRTDRGGARTLSMCHMHSANHL